MTQTLLSDVDILVQELSSWWSQQQVFVLLATLAFAPSVIVMGYLIVRSKKQFCPWVSGPTHSGPLSVFYGSGLWQGLENKRELNKLIPQIRLLLPDFRVKPRPVGRGYKKTKKGQPRLPVEKFMGVLFFVRCFLFQLLNSGADFPALVYTPRH